MKKGIKCILKNIILYKRSILNKQKTNFTKKKIDIFCFEYKLY